MCLQVPRWGGGLSEMLPQDGSRDSGCVCVIWLVLAAAAYKSTLIGILNTHTQIAVIVHWVHTLEIPEDSKLADNEPLVLWGPWG